ncbi:hypothetical protein ACFSTC_26320 [Nonomuraea ferruginea]
MGRVGDRGGERGGQPCGRQAAPRDRGLAPRPAPPARRHRTAAGRRQGGEHPVRLRPGHREQGIVNATLVGHYTPEEVTASLDYHLARLRVR